VVVVDQSAGFDPVADTRDGIHPNATGEEKMAAAWHAALLRVPPTTASNARLAPLPEQGLLSPAASRPADRAGRDPRPIR